MDKPTVFEEARRQLRTVRDLLRFAVSRFTEANLYFGHGTTNAYDEAAYLVLHTLRLPLDTLEPFLDSAVTASELETVLAIIEKRARERIPAAYLTREAWLGDFRFYVDERVIVPRSFIAELLREQLNPWVSDPDSVTEALDLCTGSGCLAVLMAHAFPAAHVDAVDISQEALEVAAKNISDYGLQDRAQLIRSDLFDSLEEKRYDLIVSNPPYVDAVSMAALPPEYRHEPALALGSGPDGLDAVRHILRHGADHLTPNGLLVVEIGHNREALETAFPDIPFTWLDTSAGDEFVFLLQQSDLAGVTSAG